MLRSLSGIEIREQERHLIRHIDPTQRGIELEAVEWQQPLPTTHDVAGVQIAVTFAYAPGGKTAREQWPRRIRLVSGGLGGRDGRPGPASGYAGSVPGSERG